MEELIQLIVNNGIGAVCVAYMIYFQNTTMKEMLNTLAKMNRRLSSIEQNLKIETDEEE